MGIVCQVYFSLERKIVLLYRNFVGIMQEMAEDKRNWVTIRNQIGQAIPDNMLMLTKIIQSKNFKAQAYLVAVAEGLDIKNPNKKTRKRLKELENNFRNPNKKFSILNNGPGPKTCSKCGEFIMGIQFKDNKKFNICRGIAKEICKPQEIKE